MKSQPQPTQPSEHDKLISRPDQPLPFVLDPKSPRSHPHDPKPKPADGQGTDPKAGDLDRSA